MQQDAAGAIAKGTSSRLAHGRRSRGPVPRQRQRAPPGPPEAAFASSQAALGRPQIPRRAGHRPAWTPGRQCVAGPRAHPWQSPRAWPVCKQEQRHISMQERKRRAVAGQGASATSANSPMLGMRSRCGLTTRRCHPSPVPCCASASTREWQGQDDEIRWRCRSGCRQGPGWAGGVRERLAANTAQRQLCFCSASSALSIGWEPRQPHAAIRIKSTSTAHTVWQAGSAIVGCHVWGWAVSTVGCPRPGMRANSNRPQGESQKPASHTLAKR